MPVSLQCAACHPRQFEEWSGSDHAWAWRPVQEPLDAEPFHGQSCGAVSARTDRRGRRWLDDGESGASYRVHSVLGRTPLIQYLVEGKDGGLHVPSAAWDVRKFEWFDVFRDDARLQQSGEGERRAGEWGHWLGRGMNWNSQCAWCHMSGFRKNYREGDDTYASTWQEPGVTCIQCHRLSGEPSADGCMVAVPDRRLTAQQVHDYCASCHARREELDDSFAAGDRFHDHFRLELPLIEGIFWPNGMQQDEDYCETGLLLSRMGQAGVSCLDCHDPHTAGLKLSQDDDSLCLRCHAGGSAVQGTPAPVIDRASHSPCPPGQGGARCVDCHMPESLYMARDPRRDHSFNAPDPLLGQELGIPVACAACHRDRGESWFREQMLRFWPEQKSESRRARTRAVAAAMRGQGDREELIRLYHAEKVDAWKATLLGLLARLPVSENSRQLAREAAQSSSELVRAAAAPLLGDEASDLLLDSCKLVRRAAGWPLVAALVKKKLAPATLQELQETAHFQSDQPTGAMQLAVLAETRGDRDEADQQYLRAINMDPNSPVARMDYAVFLARSGRLVEALSQMLTCAVDHPGHVEVQYRLGLILGELGRTEAALKALNKAVELDPSFIPARYNRAVLLRHLGREEEARHDVEACQLLQSVSSY